jgi:uncharacterized OB-fold protein
MSAQLPIESVTESPETRPFWDGARAGELVLPYCPRCERTVWYPRNFCPTCAASPVQWRAASGRGVIYSYTTIERGAGAYADVGRYVLAYVELEEGPRVLTNVIGKDPDEIEVDDLVTIEFEGAGGVDAVDGAVVMRARWTGHSAARG